MKPENIAQVGRCTPLHRYQCRYGGMDAIGGEIISLADRYYWEKFLDFLGGKRISFEPADDFNLMGFGEESEKLINTLEQGNKKILFSALELAIKVSYNLVHKSELSVTKVMDLYTFYNTPYIYYQSAPNFHQSWPYGEIKNK